jgi:hypothetical protein
MIYVAPSENPVVPVIPVHVPVIPVPVVPGFIQAQTSESQAHMTTYIWCRSNSALYSSHL